jgi:hypothetical protein
MFSHSFFKLEGSFNGNVSTDQQETDQLAKHQPDILKSSLNLKQIKKACQYCLNIIYSEQSVNHAFKTLSGNMSQMLICFLFICRVHPVLTPVSGSSNSIDTDTFRIQNAGVVTIYARI